MQIEAVRLLVELGANLQAADGLGRTVIGAALDFKGYHVARWLERAAGWSALHRACDARRALLSSRSPPPLWPAPEPPWA